jgi:hypothetical protein
MPAFVPSPEVSKGHLKSVDIAAVTWLQPRYARVRGFVGRTGQ